MHHSYKPKQLPATTKDICWLAGILEGEGSFTLGVVGKTLPKKRTPKITIGMSDEDVVRRVASILGSKSCYTRPQSTGVITGTKPMYRTECQGARAAGWMMTLYPLLGLRRQAKVQQVLKYWRDASA